MTVSNDDCRRTAIPATASADITAQRGALADREGGEQVQTPRSDSVGAPFSLPTSALIPPSYGFCAGKEQSYSVAEAFEKTIRGVRKKPSEAFEKAISPKQ
eukprot:6213515-Pleurochrysis_carterae.AAC.1